MSAAIPMALRATSSADKSGMSTNARAAAEKKKSMIQMRKKMAREKDDRFQIRKFLAATKPAVFQDSTSSFTYQQHTDHHCQLPKYHLGFPKRLRYR